VLQVHDQIEQVTGRKVPLKRVARRAGDPAVLYANPVRIMNELGWRPEHSSLREILESAWRWKQQCSSSPVLAAFTR
jgi:UDP-glucose 4-epimerase